jgi:hypothetical protein
MSPQEQKFRAWLREELAAGRVPTPTSCLAFLGRNPRALRVGGPSLNGAFSAARRDEFAAAGLKKDPRSGRWYLP